MGSGLCWTMDKQKELGMLLEILDKVESEGKWANHLFGRSDYNPL